MKEYIALFEYEDGAAGVGVVFPDLPGCISYGEDFDAAYRNAHEALSLYADGEGALPAPRTMEQIRREWEEWSEWEGRRSFHTVKVALYPLKASAKKFNISMDESIVARIDRVTSNRSAFIAEAVTAMLKAK
ncbi:MAG: type II toxin-antitoxin system HicB family antitoxin [Clostridiales Family XIII bacterium]|jgi:predicted RNase H-like HicB family nuclease|nr:type II toxin-antitoxin system HicB family antitoxin [Clostridiales Family XIII bacterium]